MEVGELLNKVFSKPVAQVPAFPGAADPLGGVRPEPTVSKSNSFDPKTIQFAQSVYAATGPQAGGQQGQNNNSSPNKGTVGGMIPPGWSSQPAK